LRAFRPIVPKKDAKRLKRALRRVAPALGRARDWDVLEERIGPSERTGKERDQARRAARRVMASEKFARVVARAKALDVAESPKTLAQFGTAALAREHGKLIKEARGVEWGNPAQRHAVRIRVKRLRYTCEFFASAFPAKRTAPYLRALKELQTVLGELNDIAVGQRLIGLQADETPLLRRLDAAWKRFAKRPPFWRAPA
jgi:CHAD domain-containing protein